MARRILRYLTVLSAALLVLPLVPTAAAARAIEIWLPVQEPVAVVDSWGAPRSGGRSHEGTDLMAPQMRPVFAAADGVIRKAENEHVRRGQYASSYYLLLEHDDGHSSFYVHLNNDTPGRPAGCDGRGGAEGAFSPRLIRELRQRGTLQGVRVRRGEHIAFNGSSGNAGCGNDHLHFELWRGHGWDAPPFNPYLSLKYAERDGRSWGPGQGTGDTENAALEVRLPAPVPTGRLAGRNRIGTAVRMSQHSFRTADTVVLAPAETPAEGLVAGPLAATLDAPVLLVAGAGEDGPNVTEEVAAEIERLGAEEAVLVGGPDRLTADVERELVVRAGLDEDDVRRVGGDDVYETAAAVAEETLERQGGGAPLLAVGSDVDADRSWPDALAAATLGALEEVPVLLTAPDELPAATSEALARPDVEAVRIVGGTAAVSEGVDRSVRALGLVTDRLAGRDRYATSVAVAGAALDAGAAPSEVYVATGRDFPDALAAAPAIAARARPLVLVDGSDPAGASSTHAWLRDHASDIGAIAAVGGPSVLPDAVLVAVARSANWPPED